MDVQYSSDGWVCEPCGGSGAAWEQRDVDVVEPAGPCAYCVGTLYERCEDCTRARATVRVEGLRLCGRCVRLYTVDVERIVYADGDLTTEIVVDDLLAYDRADETDGCDDAA